MGKATLTFDQMEILLKKSDSDHSDNDWIIIVWFKNGDVLRTDKISLLNTAGSPILDSGNVIAPIASDAACSDTDFISATYVVVNLGSYDFEDQAQAAEQLAEEIAKKLTEVYLKAAQLVVANSPIPLAEVWAKGIEAISPTIVDSVGALFEDVIIPGFNDLIDEINVLLGRPNCNGPVLNDIVLYPPYQPIPDMTIFKTYTSSPLSGCGSPAKTSVQLTLQRDLDPQAQFPNSPKPQVDIVPSQGESADNWIGQWAEDPTTPAPLILVNITRLKTVVPAFDVTIRETVDPRFDVTFETAGYNLQPQQSHLLTFGGNVFGTVRPWVKEHVGPSVLQAYHFTAAMTASDKTKPAIVRHGVSLLAPMLKLSWNRPSAQSSGVVAVPLKAGISSNVVTASPELLGYEAVQELRLPDQGITLALYSFLFEGVVIGHGVRYLRDANASYTRADVMLVHWNPLH